ncbi:unnamed protein product [Prunus armeniaca]
MMFLLYWLNKFIFPNRSSAVLLEYKHLAEALHNHTDVGLGPRVLAHLFKNLHTATLENPLNLSAPGAFWMIQIWLQVYFQKLRFPDIVMPEDQVLALLLMSVEVPKKSIKEYMMFFRHCTKRSAAQWKVVIRRTYPWFHPGKKFLSVTLPRDLPFGGGKPPNYHSGAEVYHPNFCARQLGCPQLIPLKSYRSCSRATSWRDSNDLEVHKDARCSVNKINNSADALYPSWEPNSCSSAEFDAWWKARFQGLPASSTTLKVLFDGWDSWAVHAGDETHRFMVQTIKDINAQVMEDPSLTKNIGGQVVQAGEVIIAGDLELPFGDEGDAQETLAEQTSVETTPSARGNKRKETAQALDSVVQLENSAENSPPPLTTSKRLRKRTVVEYVATESVVAPTTTSGTDKELREAFEAVEQEKDVVEGVQEKTKKVEDDEEIPVEVIAESIALAKQHQEAQRTEPTSSELALSDDVEAEHSVAVPEPEGEAKHPIVVPVLEVEKDRTAGLLTVAISPLKPLIVAIPIHSIPSSPATTSFADPEWQSSGQSKIWQSTELDLDENREAVDQLMKDLDLLHRENMAPRPILELSLVLARDVLNLHTRYEDLMPSFNASEFYKAMHEANLADYQKQKAELDILVADYKEAKTVADKLEKYIEELQEQLAGLREKQNKLVAGLGTKTKATFLVQNMVSASRPALEIAEASLHQGMLLQQEISTKKTGLQENLRKLGL